MPYPAYAGVNSPVGLISAAHQAYCGQVLRAEYRTLRFDLAEVRLGSDGGGGRLTQRCALRPSGRCLRQRFLAFARIEPYSKLLILPRTERYETLCLTGIRYATGVMVVGEGFEPSKSMTADLQSAPFGRSGTPPGVIQIVGKA